VDLDLLCLVYLLGKVLNGTDKCNCFVNNTSSTIPKICFVSAFVSLTVANREGCRLRVFESRVLRWVFGPNTDEVTREWRRLHNKELCAIYSSPNIVRVIKSRRLRWAGHVARMGRGEMHTGLWWGNLRE
jgi:hypothetical protein